MSASVLPTFGSQTELAGDEDASVRELRQTVSNTHGSSVDIDPGASNIGAPEVRPDVLSTQAADSRIHHHDVGGNLTTKALSDPPDGIHTTSSTHHDTVENQGSADGQDRAVGNTDYFRC